MPSGCAFIYEYGLQYMVPTLMLSGSNLRGSGSLTGGGDTSALTDVEEALC